MHRLFGLDQNDLLDVGRLTTGKIQLRKELLRLSDVVARSIETARPMVSARRHELHVEQPAEDVHVHGDGTRLAQVLQNLLVNAAKFTPEGGRIQLRVSEGDGFAYVAVQDNGRGITPEQLRQIFQLFAQADSPSSAGSESGLGIGLTLARTLSEMHGGSLDATSPGLGQGSTFTVRLPLAAEVVSERGEEAAEAATGALRVLVVDDNRDAADSATDVLRLLGNVVETAYDGPSGVDAARRFRPDMVFLDLAMPGLDGYETYRRFVQAGFQHCYYVAMTGFGNADDKRRTREAGFDSHLTKPVELDALVTLLNEAQARTARLGKAP